MGVKHACKRRDGAKDRLHAPQISRRPQGLRCELLMNAYVRVRVYCAMLQLANQRKIVFGCCLFERPLPPPSQDRNPEISGQYEITEKWLRTQVGNPRIDAPVCAHRHRWVKQFTVYNCRTYCAQREMNEQNHHTDIKQFRFSSRLWILVFVLLVGMSPNTCNGACVPVMHPQSRPNTKIVSCNTVKPLTVFTPSNPISIFFFYSIRA